MLAMNKKKPATWQAFSLTRTNQKPIAPHCTPCFGHFSHGAAAPCWGQSLVAQPFCGQLAQFAPLCSPFICGQSFGPGQLAQLQVVFCGQFAQSICFCGQLTHFTTAASVSAGLGVEVAVTALVMTDTAMAAMKRNMMATLFIGAPLLNIFNFLNHGFKNTPVMTPCQRLIGG
jgi:hypothetical protein